MRKLTANQRAALRRIINKASRDVYAFGTIERSLESIAPIAESLDRLANDVDDVTGRWVPSAAAELAMERAENMLRALGRETTCMHCHGRVFLVFDKSGRQRLYNSAGHPHVGQCPAYREATQERLL